MDDRFDVLAFIMLVLAVTVPIFGAWFFDLL
jgi:hypothetical protein